MVQSIREVMTPNPVAMSAGSTVTDAARAMRDNDIGDVVVLDSNENVCGIVTDRDIAVRAVAEGHNPAEVELKDICSRALVSLGPASSVDDAVRLMREQALRRLPVVDAGKAVGIVSLGDLAMERDPESALAEISAAPSNT
jgi:CBS domain-containing protein